jgi:ribonucleoside-diphosphate reductase alpha chain
MLNLSENSKFVLQKRFLRRDAKNRLLESPEDLFKRVASAVARAEVLFGNPDLEDSLAEGFYEMMTAFDFLPNSPTLMNAGTPLNQLSACFVLPVEDDLKSIFETLKNAAIIQQSGGGTGFNFSKLRPRGDFLARTGGEAAGPVSFMKVFDATTDHVKQGGRRRGANMAILNVDHPDILEFINVKRDGISLRNFNLSVGISDAFMQAIEQDSIWRLKNPRSGEVKQEIPAKALWDAIIQAAWECGDPGLIFLDTINRKNPTPGLGEINATNPCGEVPLLDYEACNLGSINLANMVRPKGSQWVINWQKLKTVIHLAVRFLDNVIEVNHYPLPAIRDAAKGNRKIGLGVMGWADMLIKLKIPYDSHEAIKLGGKIMRLIKRESFQASVDLAKERGVFAHWDKSIYYPYVQIRNATRTSIAPTGTISILANTSSSIEPLFALVFDRQNILDGEHLREVNPLLASDLIKLGQIKSADELINSDLLLKDLPDDLLKIYRTALDISWQYHLKHQMIFQKYTDNAVSKTINLPKGATIEQVSNVYLTAWKNPAKGITIYRNRSRSEQVLYAEDINKNIPVLNHEGLGDCKVCVE